jgi:hypothetical protein
LFISLPIETGGIEFIEHDSDQFALRAAECCDNVLHGVLDIKIDRQPRGDPQ